MSTLDQRCPQCAALVRGGTGWCTLCYADLRPAPVPDPVAEFVPDPEPVLVVVEDAARDLLEDPDELRTYEELVAATSAPWTGGKHAKQPATSVASSVSSPAPSPVVAVQAEDYSDLMVDVDDTDVMFALLRADGRDPILAKLEGPLSSPGARAGLIIGGGLALTAVLFVVLALVGAVLR